MASKRKNEDAVVTFDPGSRNLVEIVPLGAGQEVGRSCIILKYVGKTVMLDCGIHPGYSGMQSLPFFDEVDLDTVDVMLITHFHLDHCAAVPYVCGHTPFKGKIYMTHPTKVIYGELLRDFVRVTRGNADDQLYKEEDLKASLDRIQLLDFHQTIDVDGIQITAYRAGHVLGASMFMVEIAGMRCLYTGDYSRVSDRHMPTADLPELKPHIVIVEATYGVSRHLPRAEREERFVSKIRQIVTRGGRCLLPVVALGRAQELLLILEEYWERCPEMRGVPIYQASGLARRGLSVYQTYIEMMNEEIKAAFQTANPFVMKHVKTLKSSSQLDDVGPCVVLATPSMLQSGLSRELFEAWCEDPRNGIIIADFAVQGTLAREILSGPETVLSRSGQKLKLRMTVDANSFSAHADFPQTSEFVETLAPPHVVLVHGEAGEMARLKKALEQQAVLAQQPRSIWNPRVAQPVHIRHQAQYIAKVVGKLAEKVPTEGRRISGLLVRHGAEDVIMQPADLPSFTKMHTCTVLQRQAILIRRPFSKIRLALEMMFEGVYGDKELGGVAGNGDGAVLRVGGAVTVTHQPGGRLHGPQSPQVVLEWEGGATADTIADAIVTVILQEEMDPPGVQQADKRRRLALEAGDLRQASNAEMHILAELLRNLFGPTQLDEESGLVTTQVDDKRVVVDHNTWTVECEDESLCKRVGRAVQRLHDALKPCPL